MPKSRYEIVKEGWGTRQNFQASYGLGMAPEDIARGNAILDAFCEHDADEERRESTTSEGQSSRRDQVGKSGGSRPNE